MFSVARTDWRQHAFSKSCIGAHHHRVTLTFQSFIAGIQGGARTVVSPTIRVVVMVVLWLLLLLLLVFWCSGRNAKDISSNNSDIINLSHSHGYSNSNSNNRIKQQHRKQRPHQQRQQHEKVRGAIKGLYQFFWLKKLVPSSEPTS